METHIKTLGILNIILGALGVLVGFGMLLMFGGIAGMVSATSHDPDAAMALPVLGAIGGIIFVIVVIVSVPVIIAGWGIMNYKEWARILGIVVSVIQLVNVPIGTALGIYGLWVLTQARTAEMFRQLRAI